MISLILLALKANLSAHRLIQIRQQTSTPFQSIVLLDVQLLYPG
ncbi:hypothetical protein GPAL_1050 [Glaciecola pallidula DSM 14239 = ACAM 615]|jgi:hypothetical protein|uniref:Uncharacterized protein n=1 Tax=Brumicola pallidula DSM 14239 = ACAM 615 TaxID=1121922 RepID=K6Y566_9ALTE|nr:hypothetical protein GPAL_1050 [Glaciecola pallidula DSM 14239 = ACAM 615]